MAFGGQLQSPNHNQKPNTMNVRCILNKNVELVTPLMHKVRQASLRSCLYSLLSGSSATVTDIGRGIDSATLEKHRIKRADRLLSNTHLYREINTIYSSLTAHLTTGLTRPIILVDWSDLDPYKRHFLLRASLAVNGRGLTLYEEVHSINTKEKPATHKRFLECLHQMMDKTSRPIIVTDAGFKSPWFRQVKALGWDFVGRVRKPHLYTTDNQQWQCISVLYKQATTRPRALKAAISKSNPFACHLVIIKQKKIGRKRLNRSGKPKQSKASLVHERSANDPWLLSTSLPMDEHLSREVVNIYRSRMQIEESFRDIKSERFGLGFNHNHTYKLMRMKVLVLLATLAHWTLMMIGIISTAANQHYQYQVNSTRHKRTLSFHFIGLRTVANRTARFTQLDIQRGNVLLKEYALAPEVFVS